MAADHAREDSDIAQATAKQFAPDFKQPGLEKLKAREAHRSKLIPQEDALHKVCKETCSPPKNENYSILLFKQAIIPNDISANQIPNQVPTNPSKVLAQKKSENYAQIPNNTNFSPNYQTMNQVQSPNNPTSQHNFQSSLNVKQQAALSNQLQELQQQIHQQSLQQQKEQQMTNQIHEDTADRLANSTELNNVNNSKATIRRNSKLVQGDRPNFGSQQLSIDHFDHYKRPPSRDSSVDR